MKDNDDDDVDIDNNDNDKTMINNNNNDTILFDSMIQKLLLSLGTGARAVQGLPTTIDDYNYECSLSEFGNSHLLLSTHQLWYETIQSIIHHPTIVRTIIENNNANNQDDDNDNEDRDNDMTKGNNKNADINYNTIINDPILWDECTEVCEMLLEQINDMSLTVSSSTPTSNTTHNKNVTTTKIIENVTNIVQHNSNNQWKLIESMINSTLPKPQLLYRHLIPPIPNNDRTIPFIPPLIHEMNKPFHIMPLSYTTSTTSTNNSNTKYQIQLLPGHGLDNKYKIPSSTTNTSVSATATGAIDTTDVAVANHKKLLPFDIIAPTEYCPHLYETEINSFTYTTEQLQINESIDYNDNCEKKIPAKSVLDATYVDTVQGLVQLVSDIENANIQEIAIDLEAHSYRSFAGFVCLMQLSIRSNSTTDKAEKEDDATTPTKIRNYLIDTIVLDRQYITIHLAPIFANPTIVKILHGSDHDVQWLQRDFGIYVVNLFDTGRAARQLQYQSASYAYLLQRYVSNELVIDKSYQLADWRQRPLPVLMKQYAIQDTYYLLDIYDRIKIDLCKMGGNNLIKDVFDICRCVCLLRYTPEPFKPSGYKLLIRTNKNRTYRNKRRVNNELNIQQENVLKILYDWRDQTARVYDESIQYVCSNTNLVRIALSCPPTIIQLQSLFNPIPKLVLKHSQDIIQLIHNATIPTAQVVTTNVDEQQQQQQPTPQVRNTKHSVATTATATTSTAASASATLRHGDADENEESDEEIGAFNRHSSSTKGADGDDEDDDVDDDDFEEDDEEEEDDDDEEVKHHNQTNTNLNNRNSVSAGTCATTTAATTATTQSTVYFKPAPINTPTSKINSAVGRGSGGVVVGGSNNPTVTGNSGRGVSGDNKLYRRGMMSPVLGTEALYKQAGWMTPQEQHQIHTTSSGGTDTWGTGTSIDESESSAAGDFENEDNIYNNNNNNNNNTSQKPNRLLSVHPSNAGYQTKQNVDHNLSINNISEATAQVALVNSLTSYSTGSHSSDVLISDDAASFVVNKGKAIHDANLIRTGLQDSIPAVLGVATTNLKDSDDDDDDEDDDDGTANKDEREKGNSVTGTLNRNGMDSNNNKISGFDASTSKMATTTAAHDQPFAIPKSIREIYKISNRNRRNKKANSPSPDKEFNPINEKEQRELMKAEALLRQRGLMGDNSTGSNFLFADETGSGSSKRPRAKSSGRESEESVPDTVSNVVVGQDEDLAFMKQVGWIRNEEDVDDLLNRRYGKSGMNTPFPDGHETDIHSSGVDEIDNTTTRQRNEQLSTTKLTPNRYSSSSSPYDRPGSAPMGSSTPVRPTTASPAPIGFIPQSNTRSFAIQNNPFFTGAALAGGPLTHTGSHRFQSNNHNNNSSSSRFDNNYSTSTATKGTPRRTTSGGSGRGGGAGTGAGGGRTNRGRQNERPDKRGERSFAYRNKK